MSLVKLYTGPPISRVREILGFGRLELPQVWRRSTAHSTSFFAWNAQKTTNLKSKNQISTQKLPKTCLVMEKVTKKKHVQT